MKNQTRLATYLALTAGAGLAPTDADAATVVTFYGPGATPPAGINIGQSFDGRVVDSASSSSSYFPYVGFIYFTRGTDLPAAGGGGGNGIGPRGFYYNFGAFRYGAVAGNQNYISISFNGRDSVYEAVAQFSFTGTTGGYLVALAKNSDNTALSISAGKAAIDAVPAPPSPSSLSAPQACSPAATASWPPRSSTARSIIRRRVF